MRRRSERDLPTITIVTPSLNQGRFVEATVRSVLLQRYPRLEYIFMDGGSTDDTLQRVEPYREWFAHFESGPDGGQSMAIAKGFSLSSGAIMAYLNSDDVLLPGTLNFVAGYFGRHPDVDFIYGHRCIIDENGRVVGHWILPSHSSFLMSRWDLIPQETCFWRRQVFERAGNVDSGLRFAMDYDLFVRFMERGKGVRVNRFMASFRMHPASKTSTQLSTLGQEEILAVRARYGLGCPPLLGSAYAAYVRFSSARWLRRKGTVAGLPAGVGYSLADVWANLF
jgi:glycosyltransferase involved in cell wall biosynthesis